MSPYVEGLSTKAKTEFRKIRPVGGIAKEEPEGREKEQKKQRTGAMEKIAFCNRERNPVLLCLLRDPLGDRTNRFDHVRLAHERLDSRVVEPGLFFVSKLW